MSNELELIEHAFRAYVTVFQMGNPRAITPYYHVPSVVISPGGTFVLAKLNDVEQFFERYLFGLRSRGYHRGTLAHVQVKLLSDEIALVNARTERYKLDGEVLEQEHALYTLRKLDGTWRIAAATIYDPQRPLELG